MKKNLVCILLTITMCCLTACVDPGSTENEAAGSTETIEELSEETVDENPQEALQDTLKDSQGIIFFGQVPEDNTDCWRSAAYANGNSVEEFAVEYYKAYFENDEEIHALCNLQLNTTTKISKLDDSTLDVVTYEYVKGEEHSATLLFTGMKLTESWIDIESGDIEKID